MDFSDEQTKKRAMRVLALVVVVIIIVFILTWITGFFIFPSLIGTILVVCIIAYVAHRIYVNKRQSGNVLRCFAHRRWEDDYAKWLHDSTNFAESATTSHSNLLKPPNMRWAKCQRAIAQQVPNNLQDTRRTRKQK